MKKLLRVLSCVMTVVLTISMLAGLTHLMERKDSTKKNKDFFEQEADFDVLFFGTSHMMNGIYPMELYKNYGIVSYNFGQKFCQLANSYWLMENAFDYTTPKVVVIDCLELSMDIKGSPFYENVMESFDAFPMSVTKAKAIRDLTNDAGQEAYAIKTQRVYGDRPKSDLIWNFSRYHSRWNELKTEDFSTTFEPLKGADPKVAVTINPYPAPEKPNASNYETVGREYLCKMIEDCQARGIDVVLTYMPYQSDPQHVEEAASFEMIAKEYGVDYINLEEENLISDNTDWYDAEAHLNPSGARKVTDYVGRYLVEKYNVPDQRNNPKYSKWNEDVASYDEYFDGLLLEQEYFNEYMMLLSHSDYDVEIKNSNPKLYSFDFARELLENAGVKTPDLTEDAKSDSFDSLTVTVSRDGQLIDKVTFDYIINEDAGIFNVTSMHR